MMMAASSLSVLPHRGDGRTSRHRSLAGGILPFRTATTAASSGPDCRDPNVIVDSCCGIFSEVFSSADPRRRDRIVNSLLSMVSDSFVRSTPTSDDDTPSRGGNRRKRSQQHHHRRKNSSDGTGGGGAAHRRILLEAARAACRTLLLISNDHGGSELSQIRGTVLDRLLLLASMPVSTTTATGPDNAEDEENASVYYHLFDMNSAILISLLQDTHHRDDHHMEQEEDEALHRSSSTTTTTANGGSGSSSELLILCQKLLFSSNFTSSANSTTSNSYQHRAICGLILASRLLRCRIIPNGERGSIWSWIITVVSPSPSAVTPLVALDPKIARWGLRFLHFASSAIPLSAIAGKAPSDNFDGVPFYPEINRFVDTQSVCGRSDVFNQVNKMLATAAIIQMEDSLRVPLSQTAWQDEESVVSPHTFFAFADVSTHDHLRKTKSATATSMVICAPYFLHGKLAYKDVDHNKPFLTCIDLVASYVHDLVDRYLELGMLKSGTWNPRGWLLAKIQLPCCLSEPAMQALGMEKHYGLELDADLGGQPCSGSFSSIPGLDASDDSFRRRWRILFADETKSKAALLRNLVEFVNCLIISISVSCATLKHAHRHFENEEVQLSMMATNEATRPLLSTPKGSGEAKRLHRRKRKQLEALRKLLQFQVNKIHTMQRICRNICLGLDGLHSEVHKLNSVARADQRMVRYLKKEETSTGSPMKNIAQDGMHPNEYRISPGQGKNKASYQRKQIPLSEVKSIITAIETFLSSDANIIHSSVLWSCLDDDIDDTILLENLGNLKPKEVAEEIIHSSFPKVSRVFRLRKKLLQELQKNIIQLNNNKNGHPVTDSEGKRLHFDVISPYGVSRIFRMAISLSPYLHKIGKGQGRQQSTLGAASDRSSLGVFLAVHYKLLLAVFSFATKDAPLRSSKNSVLPHRKCKQPSELQDSNIGGSLFADITQRCAEALPSFQTSQISSKAIEESVGSPSTLSTLSDALSETLLQELKHCEDACISCHILDLLSIFFIHTECSGGILAKVASDNLHSVYTSSVGRPNLPYIFFKLNSTLIERSKNAGTESVSTPFEKESLTPLIRTSNTLLKTKDTFMVAFVHHILAHWSVLTYDGTSQFHCLNEMVIALDNFLSTSFQRWKENSSPRLFKRNSLPSLNEKTYTALFELLLHMINASLSLSKPHRSKRKRSFNSYQKEGPYGEIRWPIEIYGKLLSIYQSNHVFFPRRIILTVVKSSLLIVRLSDRQLQNCLQWRNSQRPQIGIGMDSAAVELLQPLIDTVAHRCIGSIISFCHAMKVQKKGESKGWGSTYKHAKAISGLLYGCEGIKVTLLGICQSQSLQYPKDFTPNQEMSPSLKRKRGRHTDDDIVETKKQREKKHMSYNRQIRSRDARYKMSVSPSVLELLPESDHNKGLPHDRINSDPYTQSDSEDSQQDVDNDDDDSDSMLGSDDDDSFGVVGNWAT